MTLPVEVKMIRTRYLARFPVPQIQPGESITVFEARTRVWSVRFAEQVAYELPGQGWGVKRADPTRPISKDTIAQQQGAVLLAWDLLLGAGTGSPSLIPDPDSQDVTGQYYEVRPEYFSPRDHLSSGSPVPPDPPVPPPLDLSEVLRRLDALTAQVEAITPAVLAAIQAIPPAAPVSFPAYRGKVLGFAVVLRPE
jgi:hypothetical protein